MRRQILNVRFPDVQPSWNPFWLGMVFVKGDRFDTLPVLREASEHVRGPEDARFAEALKRRFRDGAFNKTRPILHLECNASSVPVGTSGAKAFSKNMQAKIL